MRFLANQMGVLMEKLKMPEERQIENALIRALVSDHEETRALGKKPRRRGGNRG